MRFTSAKSVIEVAKERGLSIRVDPGPPPMPILTRPGKVDGRMVTDALMNALKVWRLEIIEELGK
jgi:hypothetical protein